MELGTITSQSLRAPSLELSSLEFVCVCSIEMCSIQLYQQILSIHYLLCSVPGAQETAVNMADRILLMKLTIWYQAFSCNHLTLPLDTAHIFI